MSYDNLNHGEYNIYKDYVYAYVTKVILFVSI